MNVCLHGAKHLMEDLMEERQVTQGSQYIKEIEFLGVY